MACRWSQLLEAGMPAKLLRSRVSQLGRFYGRRLERCAPTVRGGTTKSDSFNQEFQRHRSHLYRVRVLVYPITPYVQWEFHCLRLRAECGEKIRLVNLSEASTAESADPRPELISLCGRVLYHIICDDDQKSDGAIRYDDPRLISHYEQFARDLYGGGEDIESYFRRRKIADLPPPRP